MKSDSGSGPGPADLERVIAKAAVEAAKMSSQASRAARRIMSEMAGEVEAKGYDFPAVDILDEAEEIIAFVALPGASKDKIDLKVTEDSLSVEAEAAEREGRYLRRETSQLGMKREIKLPVEIKPEQVKASFKDGVLEVHLPKLVVVSAQKVSVD
jgi:HSP20 family protein